jgi:hypothetical protein
MTSKQKCVICGMFDAYRKCMYCQKDLCSSENCVVAYVMGTQDDRAICINCA